MNYNKTTKFLLASLKLDFKLLAANGFIDSFLGDNTEYDVGNRDEYKYDGNLLLLFETRLVTEEVSTELVSHPNYCCSYDPSMEFTIFVFDFPEILTEKQLADFKEGKYSSLDGEFLEEVHPLQFGKVNHVRMVVKKSTVLREYQESRIGMELPKDAEVWSRPELDEEIFNLENYDDAHTTTINSPPLIP